MVLLTKIMDMSQPVVITAWGGYASYSITLPGYISGDEIELR